MALINSIEELDRVRDECKSMVTTRSFASAAAAAVPVPGTDIAVDIGLLMEMIPLINRKFGLTTEQIDQLDPQTRGKLVVIITSVGSGLIGRAITKEAVVTVMKKVGVHVATKSVVKYIPLIGTAIATSVSFGAMKWMRNSHVDDCYNTVNRLLSANNAPVTTPA